MKNHQHNMVMGLEPGKLISLIYEGVMEAKPWTAFAEALRAGCGALAVSVVFKPDEVGHPEHSVIAVQPDSGIDWEALNAYYVKHYRLHDPTGNRNVSPGELRSIEDYRTCAFYTDFLRPAGIEHSVRMGVGEPDGLQCWIAIAKAATQGLILTEETALLRSLVPHFERALAIFARLLRSQIEKELYQQSIERLALGNILLDAKKRVISVNRVAQRLLNQSAGIFIQGGFLKLDDRLDNTRLQVALNRAVIAARGTESPVVLRLPRQGLVLLVEGITHTVYCETERSPHAIIHINPLQATRGGNEPEIPEELLGHLLNLSPREAELLRHILLGDTLRDAAVAMAISEKTARNHIKSVYDKTGVNRQADLVRLVYQSGVILVDSPTMQA